MQRSLQNYEDKKKKEGNSNIEINNKHLYSQVLFHFCFYKKQSMYI